MTIRRTKQESRSLAWLFVWIYTTLIFVSLPLTPAIRSLTESIFSIEFLVNGSLAIFLVVSIALLTILRKSSHARMLPYLFILGSVLISGMTLIPLPIERIHIPQYGLLAILFLRAFRMSGKRASDAYWTGFLWTILFGVLDEVAQYFLPNRYFSIRDIALNILGSFVGLFFYRFYEWIRKNSGSGSGRKQR